MGMLESDVDISTIAMWLGHESIQTTHRYMVADMRRKEDALRKVHIAGAGDKIAARYMCFVKFLSTNRDADENLSRIIAIWR